MTCLFCQAKMILATESRGYKTYRCKRGCDYHVHQEIAPAVDKNSNGMKQSGPEADNAFAPIAATV